MRKSSLWGWLSLTGIVGAAVAAGCSGSSSPVGQFNGAVGGEPCSVGQTANASDGCNTCSCGTDAKWSCTEKACGGGSGSGSGGTSQGGATCKDGDTKTAPDGCNSCSCESGNWLCTEIGCVACIPGMTKVADDGCNNCTCSGAGSWVCTDTACTACKAGETKMVDCNTCTCSDTGAWGCTKKACVVAECTPGQMKPVDCNTCACSSDGHWLCTQKACAPAMCPAPVPSGGACDTVIVWAKDPVAGQCCMYGTPCTSPAGWKTFYTESDCTGAATCPAPADSGGQACPAVVVYAKDPSTGICCQYGDPCRSPKGWKTYTTDAECQKAAL